MRPEHLNEIKGILLLSFALIILASLVSYVPEDLVWFTTHPNIPVKNFISHAGAYGAGILFSVLGYSSYLLVVFLFFWSWNIFTSRQMLFTFGRLSSLIVLLVVISGLFSLSGSAVTADRFQRGGLGGLLFADALVNYFGMAGAYIISLTLTCLCLVIAGDFLVSPLLVRLTRGFIELARGLREQKFREWLSALMLSFRKEAAPARKKARDNAWDEDEVEDDAQDAAEIKDKGKPSRQEGPAGKNNRKTDAPAVVPVKPVAAVPNIRILQPKVVVQPKDREDKPLVAGAYRLPSFDLLQDPPKATQENVQGLLVSGAKTLEQTLLSFGVAARVADIERGPVITRYEIEPAPGVRVQSINALSNDIALAMQAHSVRIQAPIPGKNRVGIEVPNGSSASVVLKDVLQNGDIRSKSKLTLALGKDISGKPMLADLAAMPHLLVAGSTGSGKSVCLNAIIMSILFNATPNEVKFIMVDPKMVELNQYNDLPHMLCPAITDHKKVVAALGWVVSEMESRYKLLAKNQVRNIAAYHAKGFEMPYIVVVIDEFADLMQTSGKVIESAVVRLAQLARAVGIHLILATQRPSVNVITGVIKANLPARIAFRVNALVDSRTILDEKGADDLLGRGDMLFLRPGDPKPTRGQCSYLSDDEIHRVVDFIKQQEKPKYDDTVTARPVAVAGGSADDKDEIFDEAVRVVMETGQASASMLQRRLGLGFSRAGRIIDQMERAGLVGPNAGSKSRSIMIDREQWLAEHAQPVDGTQPEGTVKNA
jgi:S-DNA-T family DNA segregation ATPase FtsK/SpoIIIE